MRKRVADMTPEEHAAVLARKRKHPDGMGVVICCDCETEVERTGWHQVRCGRCRLELDRRNSKEWRKRNPDYQREYFDKWKVANRERLLNGKADYAARNPELMANVQRRQRERRKAAAASATVIGVAWTPAEDAVAMDRRHTYLQAAAILGRTPGAVKMRIERLARKERYPAGRRRKSWSASEDAFIESSRLTVPEMAFALERTDAGVRRRIYYLRKRAAESTT